MDFIRKVCYDKNQENRLYLQSSSANLLKSSDAKLKGLHADANGSQLHLTTTYLPEQLPIKQLFLFNFVPLMGGGESV